MSLLPVSTDYTDKDFDSLRLRLQNLVRSVFTDWTDYNVANFGNILLEMFAFVGDVLCYYQDNQARESRIASATQRKNLIALAKLLGFRASTATAATADLTITLAAPPAGKVTFPAGSKWATPSVTAPVVFQLLASVEIAASADPPTVTGSVEHSELHSELFAATGRANQEIQLSRKPFLDDSAVIIAGNGAYTEVLNFLDSTSSDRHFVTVVDQNGLATVRFGNGVNGAVPTGTITVSYKIGGGVKGNVNANTIIRSLASYADEYGNPVSVSCTNASAASGGTNRMTSEQIRQLAPETVRVAGRTVSREDYEINARRVSGVARALMVTSDEIGMEENTGKLFVVPTGGGTPSSALKAAVLTMVTVTYPNTLTFSVEVLDPIYLDVNVYTTVFLKSGYAASTVKATIEAALADFFAVSNDDGTPNEKIDFGFNVKDADGEPAAEIAWSDVFNEIRDSVGVRKVDDGVGGLLLNGARSDLAVGVVQFPRLGTVTIINGDTGSPL